MTLQFPAFISRYFFALRLFVASIQWPRLLSVLGFSATFGALIWQLAGINYQMGTWVLEGVLVIEALTIISVALLWNMLRKPTSQRRHQ